MPSLSIKVKTVSPLFLSGADKNQPELRAASVRGQLRYWFRVIEGAKTQDLQKLWEVEEAIFGSTQCGSQVSVRLTPITKITSSRLSLLPHKGGSQQEAIASEVECTLQLFFRPGSLFSESLSQALSTWILLGGIGKRSRRMFGALEMISVGGSDDLMYEDGAVRAWWGKVLKKPEQLGRVINDHLENWIFREYTFNQATTPSFPTLHPFHSRVLIGTKPFDSMEKVDKNFFDIIHEKREYQFGSASPRRASPLIAQVRKIGGAYYPVLTIMRSSDIKDREWGILNDFMSQCEQKFDGESVWGGRLAK